MEKAKASIQFHYLYSGFYFPQRSNLKAFLLRQFAREGKQVDTVNYIFCDDAYLLAINQQYLNHDTYTDIITFELNERDAPVLSDVYISIERVKENAKLYAKSFREELRRVIFHGALHLMGYKDKSKVDSILMKKKEEEFLSLYNVSRDTVS